MPVLVTGGAGYIGSHMVLALLDAGRDVVVLDNLSTGADWIVPDPARLVVGNAGDKETVARVIKDYGIDAIAHFAASIIVPESVVKPLDYYRNNTVAGHALIETAIEAGVRRFLFSSTAAVYGMSEESPLGEDASLAPISPYGSSKLMVEQMLRDAARAHDLRYVALRYFNVAGADPQGRAGQSTPRATHLIKVACEAAVGRRNHLEIYGTDYPTPDGTCIRDYIHVSDLADAHLLALDHLEGGGENLVLNCGYGRGYSVREVIDTVKRVCGVDFEVRLADRRAGDPAVLVARADRIRETLGWRPKLDDLDAIVAHAYAWEKALMSRPRFRVAE